MIKAISLLNFRSYDKYTRDLADNICMIRGANGSGKTNLLEAIYFAATGDSFRTSNPADMVMGGSLWARADITIAGSSLISRRIEITEDDSVQRSKKTLLIDGEKASRGRQGLQVVAFEPNQLRVFYGGPSLRRELLDELASLLDVSHKTNLRKYSRILAQRRALLKDKLNRGDYNYADQLFVWDMRMSELAADIYKSRTKALLAVDDRASDIYSGFAGQSSSLDFTYVSSSSGDYQSNMLAALEASVEQDVRRAQTSVGVHRDDFFCVLDGSDLISSASRGEKRTTLLAMKLIAASDAFEQPKVLLLDDLFSELDQKRQDQLLKILPKLTHQTIATTV